MKLIKGILFIQKKKSKVFLVAFGVSLTIWLLMNLSKTYEKKVPVSLSYVNNPEDTFVFTTDSIVHVNLKGTGFSLIGNKFENLTYTIDTKKNNTHWIWQVDDYDFKKLFPKNVSVVNVMPRKAIFQVKKMKHKVVPIHSKIEVSTKLGYGIKSINLGKTHTTVYGDKKAIDTITHVQTKQLTFEELTESVSGKVIIEPISKYVKITDQEITYMYSVERYTQGNFQVPVQIKNKPIGKEVSIFPKEVNVQFQAALSEFSKYKTHDFKVYVNFEDANETNKLPLHFEEVPKGVKNAKILKQQLTYLIVEK